MIAVTLQAADQGDTTTMKETLVETAENVATVLERGAEKALPAVPQAQVSDAPMAEIVADKGYHSSDVVMIIEQVQARPYIPERKREGGRRRAGKIAKHKAVYETRRRVKGSYGKLLLKHAGNSSRGRLHTTMKPAR